MWRRQSFILVTYCLRLVHQILTYRFPLTPHIVPGVVVLITHTILVHSEPISVVEPHVGLRTWSQRRVISVVLSKLVVRT